MSKYAKTSGSSDKTNLSKLNEILGAKKIEKGIKHEKNTGYTIKKYNVMTS